MATVKLTVTLDADQIQAVRRLVANGRAASVSGFVQHAVTVALHDTAGWREMLTAALDRTGGPMTSQERAWADALLTGGRRRPPRRARGRVA